MSKLIIEFTDEGVIIESIPDDYSTGHILASLGVVLSILDGIEHEESVNQALAVIHQAAIDAIKNKELREVLQ